MHKHRAQNQLKLDIVNLPGYVLDANCITGCTISL